MFNYRREIVKGEKIPTWILLTPEPVPAVPGIDMGTGMQSGFFGPTNKENAVGGVRQNFLVNGGKRIKRPKFELKKKGRKKTPLSFRIMAALLLLLERGLSL